MEQIQISLPILLKFFTPVIGGYFFLLGVILRVYIKSHDKEHDGFKQSIKDVRNEAANDITGLGNTLRNELKDIKDRQQKFEDDCRDRHERLNGGD